MASGQEFPLVTMSNESRDAAPEYHQHEDNPMYNEAAAAEEEEAPPIRDEALPPYQRLDTSSITTSPLRPNRYILVPTVIYASLMLFSWVVICWIARSSPVMENKGLKVRQYYAARVTQSVVSVATIPMISAVCACAAAMFVQRQPDGKSLSLRQVMTLADRRWSDPSMYIDLWSRSDLKRYGSSFLFLAIFIHIIGAITYPIQSIFLHAEARYFNLETNEIDYGAGDYDDAIQTLPGILNLTSGLFYVDTDKPGAILALRNKLQGADAGSFQTQLWGSATRLTEYSPDSDWYAQLPNSYNTGSFQQITPRFNSSVSSSNVPASEFPANCSSVTDYFYASLNYSDSALGSVEIKACVPANMTKSPWLATNARQDFTEVLYINITSPTLDREGFILNSTSKLSMNTTAAFFELPNALNGGKPGDLLGNPNVSCDYEYGCINLNDISIAAAPEWKKKKKKKRYGYGDDSLMDQLYNSNNLLGPLAVTAIALFGPGSWLDDQQSLFDSGYDGAYDNGTGWRGYLEQSLELSQLPLYTLLDDNSQVSYYERAPLYNWLLTFFAKEDGSVFADSLTRASYFATKSLIEAVETNSYGDGNTILRSTVDSAIMPSISLAGMIVVSILMGLYLIPLLVLALYAGTTDGWTYTLDSFVMLRMGAALGQRDLPMQIGKRTSQIEALDLLPGVVRDVSGPDDKIRQLALGVGGSQLRLKARYLAYPGNRHILVSSQPRRRVGLQRNE